MRKHCHRVVKAAEYLESLTLIALFVALMGTAIAQIFLRNILDIGVDWVDPLSRMLVLWVSLVGAMVASRHNNHIKIDLFTRVLSEKAKRVFCIVLDVFVVAVSAVVAWFGGQFVAWEKMDGIMAFKNIPVWWTELIIPFAFAVIALRYAGHAFCHIKNLFRVEDR